jgi:three-Cys-motif partner protein
MVLLRSDSVTVRGDIVADYAAAWAAALLHDEAPAHPALPPRLAYLDLYGGPGRDTRAARHVVSTVASRAAEDELLCGDLLLLLNDPGPEDPDARRALARELRPVRSLVHPAQVIRRHPWLRITTRLEAYRPLGVLVHWEPWGYCALGGEDLARCMAIPQAEVLLALRFPLLNLGLGNPRVAQHLAAFWGSERTDALRAAVRGASPRQREEQIVTACVERLGELGARHVLPFRFMTGNRISALLLHAARHAEAHGRRKEVLARHATGHAQGVPDYCHDPAAAHYRDSLPVSRPLDALADDLARSYAGQTVRADDVYERHHLGRPFIRRNYTDALELLAVQGRALRLGNRVRVLG